MDQFPERPQDQLGKLVACRQGRGFGGATAGCAHLRMERGTAVRIGQMGAQRHSRRESVNAD